MRIIGNLGINSVIINLYFRALNGKLTVQEEQIAEYIDKISVMEEELKRVSAISQLWLISAREKKKGGERGSLGKEEKRLSKQQFEEVLFLKVLYN